MQDHPNDEKEYIKEEGALTEVEWQSWQDIYAVKRKDAFDRILHTEDDITHNNL